MQGATATSGSIKKRLREMGFNDADASVGHHNTTQPKFTPGSTGFSD
jgi:hypothetical protein